MLRSIAQRHRRELVFADPRPAIANLWHRHHAATSARLGPVMGLLLLLLVVLWAIGEHGQRRAFLQHVETQRYIEQFTEGPVAEARERLESARPEGETTRMAPAASVPSDDVMRDLRLAEDVETVLQFYRRLALCIRMGSCDPAAAAGWFADLPWRFHDRHQRYLDAAYPDEDLDALFSTIAPRAGMKPKSWAGLD